MLLRVGVVRVQPPAGPRARPDPRDAPLLAFVPRARGRAGAGPRRARPGARLARGRLPARRARAGRERAVPALRRRPRLRLGAPGDPRAARKPPSITDRSPPAVAAGSYTGVRPRY